MFGDFSLGEILPGNRPDDLVGRWAVIIAGLVERPKPRLDGPFFLFGGPASPERDQAGPGDDLHIVVTGDGTPFYCMEISLPFVLADVPNEGIRTFDLRRLVLRIVTDDYVRGCLGTPNLGAWLLQRTDERESEMRCESGQMTKDDAVNRGICLRCGSAIVHKKVRHDEPWRYYCPKCDWLGPLVSANR